LQCEAIRSSLAQQLLALTPSRARFWQSLHGIEYMLKPLQLPCVLHPLTSDKAEAQKLVGMFSSFVILAWVADPWDLTTGECVALVAQSDKSQWICTSFEQFPVRDWPDVFDCWGVSFAERWISLNMMRTSLGGMGFVNPLPAVSTKLKALRPADEKKGIDMINAACCSRLRGLLQEKVARQKPVDEEDSTFLLAMSQGKKAKAAKDDLATVMAGHLKWRVEPSVFAALFPCQVDQ